MYPLTLLVAAVALAGDPDDRAEIETALAGIDTADLNIPFAKSPPWTGIAGVSEPWVILTPRRIVAGPICYRNRDSVAVSAASVVERAMVVPRRVPLFIELRREGGKWKVTSFRVIASP